MQQIQKKVDAIRPNYTLLLMITAFLLLIKLQKVKDRT
jgi:hypothetical protein